MSVLDLHPLAVVRKRLATSVPRRRTTDNKYQPLTCRRHPNNATYTRSPIRIGRLFFLYVEWIGLGSGENGGAIIPH